MNQELMDSICLTNEGDKFTNILKKIYIRKMRKMYTDTMNIDASIIYSIFSFGEHQ